MLVVVVVVVVVVLVVVVVVVVRLVMALTLARARAVAVTLLRAHLQVPLMVLQLAAAPALWRMSWRPCGYQLQRQQYPQTSNAPTRWAIPSCSSLSRHQAQP